jgi:hypothetical protein
MVKYHSPRLLPDVLSAIQNRMIKWRPKRLTMAGFDTRGSGWPLPLGSSLFASTCPLLLCRRAENDSLASATQIDFEQFEFDRLNWPTLIV